MDAAPTSPVGDPPHPPLRPVSRSTLAESDGAGLELVGVIPSGDELLTAWVRHSDQATDAWWTALDEHGEPRWTRTLPFVPTALGVVAGRATFVVVDGAGTHVCVGPELACTRISPARDARIAFGPSEVALDFGIALVRYDVRRQRTSLDSLPADARPPVAPHDDRVGPCGDRWVVLADTTVHDLYGRSLRLSAPADHVVVEGARTYAVSVARDRMTDLCSGAAFSLPPSRRRRGRRVIAAFTTTAGLALVLGPPREGAWDLLYEHSGRAQVLYASEEALAGAHIVHAHVDGQGVLWLFVIDGAELRVERYAGS